MDKLESMVLEAETVSALMIHLADDDVGDTSFAVMSDLGENGTEHECDLGVHETALRASAVILAVLAELEAKDKRIAELERITEGVDQLAIDGGWTARGMSEYAKSLEAKLATPVIDSCDSDPMRQYFTCAREGDFYFTTLGSVPDRTYSLYRNEAEALFIGLRDALSVGCTVEGDE